MPHVALPLPPWLPWLCIVVLESYVIFVRWFTVNSFAVLLECGRRMGSAVTAWFPAGSVAKCGTHTYIIWVGATHTAQYTYYNNNSFMIDGRAWGSIVGLAIIPDGDHQGPTWSCYHESINVIHLSIQCSALVIIFRISVEGYLCFWIIYENQMLSAFVEFNSPFIQPATTKNSIAVSTRKMTDMWGREAAIAKIDFYGLLSYSFCSNFHN